MSSRGHTDADEAARLGALARYGVLDSDPERAFDDIALLASQVCGTPTAAVSLVDAERQWFKARVGLEPAQTPRDWSFCSVALQEPEAVLEVVDASEDARFRDNPLVTAEGGVRFYAGAPLVTSDGHALGALCVLDDVPRALDAGQRAALAALSRMVVAQLEHRRLSQSLLAVSTALERLADLSAAPDLEHAGRMLTALATELLGCDGAVLMLAEGLEDRTLDAYGARGPSPEVVALACRLRVDTARPTGSAAATARLGEPVFTPDTGRSTVADAELADLLGMASSYVMPIAGVEGVLLMWWATPQESLDRSGTQLVELLGAHAGAHLGRLLTLRQLISEASTDLLTGLPNRRRVRERLTAAEVGAAVAILDLDHFKDHNDTFGHEAGDQELRAFAAALADTVRSSDAVGRWGGEEFVLVVRDGLPAAERALSRLRSARQGSAVTFSAGVALVEENESGLEALVRADRALYAAKAAGRDRTVPAQRAAGGLV